MCLIGVLQVSDLTATNEFLLDQNATLRVSSKRNGTVSMPAVTLSQNNSAAQPQVVFFIKFQLYNF